MTVFPTLFYTSAREITALYIPPAWKVPLASGAFPYRECVPPPGPQSFLNISVYSLLDQRDVQIMEREMPNWWLRAVFVCRNWPASSIVAQTESLYGGRFTFSSSRSEVNKLCWAEGPSRAKPREFERKIYLYRWRCPCCCLATVQTKYEWRQTNGRFLGSNKLEDRLESDAICSCYATEPV